MEISKLYSLCDREKIDVYNYKMKNAKARIIEDDSTAIFMDYSKIGTEREEKELVAEELGHYYHDAYYNLNSDRSIIDRAEYRANKWKCLSLCSRESILKALKKRM